MPLTPEEEAELAELSKAPGVDPAYAQAAAAAPSGAVIDQPPTPGSESELGGIQAVFGKDWTPYAPGGMPISQTADDQARDEAALQSEAERVASMLDPRFSIVPQVLGLQTATNDLQGDEAAQRKFEAGQRDPIVIYEPPVDVVRQQLLQNPALMRAVSPDEVPTTQELAELNHDSTLYQATADWMYHQADKAATANGQKIVRHKAAPWLTLDPKELKLKIAAANPEGANQAQAFVLGVDDTAALGAGRANQEITEPTTMLSQNTRLGVNGNVPQPSREVNAWTEEEYPLSYAAGQAVGMLSPRGVFNRLLEGVQAGAGWVVKAAAKSPRVARLGAMAAQEAAPALREAAGAVGDAAAGGVAAAGEQALQEGVDATSRGELPDLAEAGERVRDVGLVGAALSGGGSAVGRGSHEAAEGIRDSPRYSDSYGRGMVRRAEPNLEWGPGSVAFGTKPNAQTRQLVRRSSEGGYIPSDVLAEEIAGPVGKAAGENARVSADRAGAARAGYHASPEGRVQEPVSHSMDEALRRVRAHYQPEADGRLRAVNDRPPPEQKAFNSLVGDVSTAPTRGATKLTPDQAGTFLGARAQAKLLRDDIEAVMAKTQAPIQRDEYLKTVDPKRRALVEEEIDASIDDIFKDRITGTFRDRPIDPDGAEYQAAEQQVLRERVGQEMLLEPFGGSLGEYLKQRGIEGVYVTPRALDAERLDELINVHGADSPIGKAAAFDRRRFSAGGKRGGYHEMLEQQGQEAARQADIQQRVAPGGKAFQPVAGLYQPHPGEKELVDDVRDLADQSGVRQQLDRMRGLQDTAAVANRSRGADAHGKPRSGGRLNPMNYADMAPLRAFPVLRALEGPLGPLREGNPGRAALLGGDETNAAQARTESGARGRYEASRDRRLKEIADAKAREQQEREQRQVEEIRRRR